jgi:hypothetical protein
MGMMKRRNLVFALPFAFLSACAKAKTPAAAGDLGGVATSGLAPLFAAGEDVVWLGLVGTVRTSNELADVRPAQLYRAIAMQPSAKMFDIWQIGSEAPVSGPSRTTALRTTLRDPAGLWLEREFTHPVMEAGVESSRLAKEQANVIALHGPQIWVLNGGISKPPRLDGAQQALFNQWRTALRQ